MYPLFKDLDNSKVLIETRNVFAKILYHATIIVQSAPHLRALKIFENLWKYKLNLYSVSNVVYLDVSAG